MTNDLPTQQPRQRVRITYEKGESIKFVSNNDEARLWERALRRADLPLLYKNGFNPQPHIQFAAPLGVGIVGINEPLDIILSPPVPLDEVRARIAAKLPPGVIIHDIAERSLKEEALQSCMLGADYTILIYAEPDEIPVARLVESIQRFLGRDVIVRERQRKGLKYTYNLRPLVLELRYEGYDATSEEHRIALRVQQRPGATGRPDEVVDALGFDDYARTLRRRRLYFSNCVDDVALLAAYPVATQDSIMLSQEQPKRRRKWRKPGPTTEDTRHAGRSISDRAADEFF